MHRMGRVGPPLMERQRGISAFRSHLLATDRFASSKPTPHDLD